jgi:hypothetical protein
MMRCLAHQPMGLFAAHKITSQHNSLPIENINNSNACGIYCLDFAPECLLCRDFKSFSICRFPGLLSKIHIADFLK